MSYCSYKCYKKTEITDEIDYISQKKSAGKDLLGIKSSTKSNNAFLNEGDVTGNSMVKAAGYERLGEYKKAINCWKRILLLHDNDRIITERASKRIKSLQIKLKSKHQGLKEGKSG